MKTGRPQLGREDCVKKDVRKTYQDNKRKEKAADREQWKGITAGKDLSDSWPDPGKLPSYVDIEVAPSDEVALANALTSEGIQFGAITDGTDGPALAPMKGGKHPGRGPLSDFERYLDWDQMTRWLEQKARNCSGRCQLFGIGQSSEGRDLKVMKIGSRRRPHKQKPSIWIDAGIHAREWISHATSLYFIDQLLQQNAEAKRLRDAYDWFIMPCVNPDGYVYSHTKNRMWRKTRSVIKGSDCIGVDANRNFNYKWKADETNSDPCSDVFAGHESMSEPEVRAVSEFILSRNGSWLVFITLHSYSQLWLAPWGYTDDRPYDYPKLERVGRQALKALYAVYNTEYSLGAASSVLYKSAGTSRDWAKGVPRIRYVYTVELRDSGHFGFLLPPDQILPTGNETWAAVKAMMTAIENEEGGTQHQRYGYRRHQSQGG
ncbi:Carboxypeptidase B [Lamellibrachia satsuma]|nr:Carboxypeptidase B [Lamellibrachia satsuma]